MKPFGGFDIPKQNYSKLPHALIELLPVIDTVAELKVVLYTLRHTWGFAEYGKPKKITIDEFCLGRKRRDGSRIDGGTGLSEPSVRAGLEKAVDRKILNVIKDDRDKGREKRFYALNIREQPVDDGGEYLDNDNEDGVKVFTPDPKDLTPDHKSLDPVQRKKLLKEINPALVFSEPVQEPNPVPEVVALPEAKPKRDLTPKDYNDAGRQVMDMYANSVKGHGEEKYEGRLDIPAHMRWLTDLYHELTGQSPRKGSTNGNAPSGWKKWAQGWTGQGLTPDIVRVAYWKTQQVPLIIGHPFALDTTIDYVKGLFARGDYLLLEQMRQEQGVSEDEPRRKIL